MRLGPWGLRVGTIISLRDEFKNNDQLQLRYSFLRPNGPPSVIVHLLFTGGKGALNRGYRVSWIEEAVLTTMPKLWAAAQKEVLEKGASRQRLGEYRAIALE